MPNIGAAPKIAYRIEDADNLKPLTLRHAIAVFVVVMPAMGLAQGVYKSIGPDGKVIYTDQPPGTAERSYATPGSTKPAPKAPAARKGDYGVQVETPPPAFANAKRATRQEPVAPPAPSADTVDPSVEKAVIGVLGLEDVVRQMEALCVRTLPTSMKRYGGAVDGWKKRNDMIVFRARQVLADAFNPTMRNMIEVGIKSRNENTLAPVNNAPVAKRIEWCDKSSDDIARGTMDAFNKDKLSQPLATYRMKAG